MEKLKTRKEIAYELGISTRTLRRWIVKKALDLPTGLLSGKFQKLIKSKFFIEGD